MHTCAPLIVGLANGAPHMGCEDAGAAVPARVVLRSRRVGGRHAYYDDDTPRRNAHWEAYGVHG